MFQRTLKQSCSFSGVGIHSGKQAKMLVLPAPVNTGIVFYRTDLGGALKVSPNKLCLDAFRATQFSCQDVTISTPEHFMAAVFALGLDNLRIELDSEELPILDGSAKCFVEGLQGAGILTFEQEKAPIVVTAPYQIEDGDAVLSVEPANFFEIMYTSNYPKSFIGTQVYTFRCDEDAFLSEIASARTYAFEHEVAALQAKGLGLGGTLDNTLVIGEEDYLNTPRFENECVRHKILDIVGDFAVLNRPILGKVKALASGHKLNAEMAQYLYTTYAKKDIEPT